MQDLKLIFLSFGAVLTLFSFANAQVPELVPIPDRLDGHRREELAARRSQLEAQWNVLVSKVEEHNQKCRKVPANTPLANECRQRMGLLQGEIAGYGESVKSFNQALAEAVQRLTSIDRIYVPPPPPMGADVWESIGWLREKYSDFEAWSNDPMHRAWLRDIEIGMLPFGAVGEAAEFGRMGRLSRSQYAALLRLSERYGIKFGISGGHAETEIGLLRRANPFAQPFLPHWRRGPVSKLGDIDLWFEGGGGWGGVRRDPIKRQVADEVRKILGSKKIDFKYGKYYPTENELIERAGGLIFDRGATREGVSHWQAPGLWRPTPEMESTFLTVWQN